MQCFRHARTTIAVAILYAIAAGLFGFAHRAAALSLVEPTLAAYALPDGTMPPLCVTDTTIPGKSELRQPCAACALGAAPGLPLAETPFEVLPTVRIIARIDVDADRRTLFRREAPTSRGPPARLSF